MFSAYGSQISSIHRNKAFEVDIGRSKIDKLIKDPDLHKSIIEALYKYHEKLK